MGSVEGMQCTALGQTADKRPMQPTHVIEWQQWGISAPFAPTRSKVWSSINSTTASTNAALDAALVSYVSAFLSQVKASPKPLNVSALPPPKQRLYALLDSIAANQTPNASSITSLEASTPEALTVHRLGKSLQELLVDPVGLQQGVWRSTPLRPQLHLSDLRPLRVHAQ